MTNFPLATQIYISISECFSSPKPVKSNHILDISSWTFQTDFKLNSRFSLSACLSSKPTMSCNIIYSVTDAREPGVIFDISSVCPTHDQTGWLYLLNLCPKHSLPSGPSYSPRSRLHCSLLLTGALQLLGLHPHTQSTLHTAPRAMFSKHKYDVTRATAKITSERQ